MLSQGLRAPVAAVSPLSVTWGLSPDWACSSPSRKLTGRIFLAGWFSGKLSSRVYLNCRASNRGSPGVRPASRTDGPTGMDFSMPVMARACRFIISCILASWSFWPCHQSSAPYSATDCTAAVEPGELILGQVHDSAIGVVPCFLRPVPCAYRSDSRP